MNKSNSIEEMNIDEVKEQNLDANDAPNQVAPADASNQVLTTDILQLNYDCFEPMFEWISLKDLLNIRLTCKQLKEHADKYTRSKYPTFKFGFGKVTIEGRDFDRFKQLDPELAKLIKDITFADTELSKKDVNEFKGLLGQIEVLQIDNGTIEGEFYESFYKFCPNVKHLTIKGIGGDTIIGPDNAWLHRSYPNLESVYFDDTDEVYETYRGSGESNKALSQFFQLNPNIRTFTTTYDYFMANWKWLMADNVALDLLKLRSPLSTGTLSDDLCDAFQELHAKGAYNRLRLSNLENEYGHRLDLNRTLPALEALHLETKEVSVSLSLEMTSLKEIGFIYGSQIKNPNNFAKKIKFVERIFIDGAKLIDVLPFVRYSAKVKEIRVDCLRYGTYFENGIVNILALNKERAKLNGACKQMITVKEDIFLATKRAAMPIDCDLVQLGCAEMSEWQPSF